MVKQKIQLIDEEEEQEYKTDREILFPKGLNVEQDQVGDVYDLYREAAGVHSKLTTMTEDYTLSRYNIDIYNLKLPKFIREQRKLVRIMETCIVTPLHILIRHTKGNIEEATKIQEQLQREFLAIQTLLLGELDETVIMGRTTEGEVITAFLKHGLSPAIEQEYEDDTKNKTLLNKLTEKKRTGE